MPNMTTQKCKCCKQSFEARTADVKRGWGIYCSKRCKAIVQEKKNGQHSAYLNGRGVSNLHPERLEDVIKNGDYINCLTGKICDPFDEDEVKYDDDIHPFSPDGHGQWND